MSSDSTRWPDGGFAPGAVLRAREQWRRDAPPPTRPSRRAAAIRARPRRGGGCKILHRGAKFLIPATSGVGFVIAAGGSMMATCAAAGAPLGAPPWCYTVISGGSTSARFYWVLARSIGLAERVGFAPLLSDARACGGRPDVGLVHRGSRLVPRNRHRQFFRMTASRHKRPIRNGRLGENKGQVLTPWSSARYRATRSVGWRRNCHAYAISIPGMPRKFDGPDFARGSVSIRR
jgi:hypothetical protein